MTLLAVLAVALFLGGLVALSHGRFTHDLAVIDQAWAGLDDDLAKRHDLVPGLVEALRGRIRRVDPSLEDVIVARRRAIQASRQAPDRPGRRVDAEHELTVTISRMLTSHLPAQFDPATDAKLQDLVERLEFLNNRIAADRKLYNLAVLGFNRRVEQGPSRLVAAIFGIRTREYFTLVDPGATSVGSTPPG